MSNLSSACIVCVKVKKKIILNSTFQIVDSLDLETGLTPHSHISFLMYVIFK